jgi:hypothetical protein
MVSPRLRRYSDGPRSTEGDADLAATVLGVHQTRQTESEDFLESASGTNGLTAAADFVMCCSASEPRSTSF